MGVLMIGLQACVPGIDDVDSSFGGPAGKADDGGDSLIVRSAGTIPVVLSVPHGGAERIPGSHGRTTGETVQDARTLELGTQLADELERRLGGRPYVVMARFSRKDVDANRDAVEAFEQDATAPYYAAYHAALRDFVDDVRARHGEGLLIDLHGQSAEPAVVFRGTRNGSTVRRLLANHGVAALVGPDSVLGGLAGHGYGVAPALDSTTAPRDEVSFNGGAIIATYGSRHDDGIDAIQLEVGRDYRAADRLAATAADLAASIGATVDRFYPIAPSTPLE